MLYSKFEQPQPLGIGPWSSFRSGAFGFERRFGRSFGFRGISRSGGDEIWLHIDGTWWGIESFGHVGLFDSNMSVELGWSWIERERKH